MKVFLVICTKNKTKYHFIFLLWQVLALQIWIFIFFSVNSKKLQKSWKICQLPFKAKNLGEKKNHPSLPMEQIFFSIFCDVATLVILHKRNQPNLATGQRTQHSRILLRILLFMLATYRNLLNKYGNYRNCFPQNLMILVQFFSRKSFA